MWYCGNKQRIKREFHSPKSRWFDFTVCEHNEKDAIKWLRLLFILYMVDAYEIVGSFRCVILQWHCSCEWMCVCVCVYWKQQAYTDFYRTLCCTSLWTVDSNDQTETRCQNMHFSFLSLRHTKKNDSNNKRIEEERNENEIETTWHSILETKVNKQIAIVERWLQFCVLSVVATMPTQAVHMYVCVWLSVHESIKHKDNGNVITQPLHVVAVTKQCERIPEPTRILKLKSS